MRASYRLPDKAQYSSRAISLIRPPVRRRSSSNGWAEQ